MSTEVYFAQFKPSEIAMSALLAATYLGYSSEFTSIERSLRISVHATETLYYPVLLVGAYDLLS